MTKDEAIVCDELPILEAYGYTGDDFIHRWEDLSRQAGQNVMPLDILWGILNELQHNLAKKGDLFELSNFSYHMAIILNKEGKNSYHCLRSAAMMRLEYYKKSKEITNVQILTGKDKSCENCRKLEGMILSINDAMIDMPIPCEDCCSHLFDKAHTFCRCHYVGAQRVW
ncbi:MAG: hypothetical protein Q8P24_01360 [Desulfobacterales bacterium]|nr:hypothetical protein [Desulfobacterales bacterium]